ncbi:hypothetical protein BSKO_05098 [Bryopsis sp. KO-2023]|nr:hypothetical protein BSKO_05098 [Bryopsis sp. KO-2023]
MPTALSRQLAQFRGFVGKERTKASLIHDPKEAANHSAEDVFRACVGGFEELCKKDNRFEPYGATLFAGVPKEREQRTKEEDERVNESITSFLRILVDHFLEPAAFKALEHLIRSYKVNEYNVDALMSCALAYHETREFVDLMATLHLDGTIWHWLSGVQKVGVPMPRSSLVQRCTKDMAVLSFLGEMAKWAAKEEYTNQRVFSFYATVVCEVLISIPQVTEELMLCLVKFIVTGLIDKCQDYRSASYMIVVTLAEHAALSDKLMAGILEALVRGESGDQRRVVTIMGHLYQTQEQYKIMSNSVLKSLVKMVDFSSMLGSLTHQGLEADAFLKILTTKLLTKSLKTPRYASILCDILAAVNFSNKIVAFVSRSVLAEGMALDMEKDKEKQESLASIIRALDCHFPEQLDKAVNKRLKQAASSKKTDSGDERKKLMEYMQRCLGGTLHQPVSDNGEISLLMAVDAALPTTRKLALQQLENLMSVETTSARVRSFANGAILRRLEDDHGDVVMEALHCSFDGDLTDPLLYHSAVKETFARAALKVTEEGTWMKIVQQSLDVLSKNVSCNPDLSDSTFAFLIGYIVLPGQTGLESSKKIVEALGKMPAPYGPLIEACLKEDGDESTSSKVISNLISKVGDGLESFLEQLLPRCEPQALHILFLAINHACFALQPPSISTIALKCVDRYWHLMESITPVAQEDLKPLEDIEEPPEKTEPLMEIDSSQPNDDEETGNGEPPPKAQGFCPIEFPVMAAGLALQQVLFSVLLGMQTDRLEKPTQEELRGWLVRILGLRGWEQFGAHIKELLKLVEESRFVFVAEVIGCPEEMMDNDVVLRALTVLFQLLKEKEDEEEFPSVMLPCVLGCMASPVQAVRKLVLENFEGVIVALKRMTAKKESMESVEQRLTALAKVVNKDASVIGEDPTGVIKTLRTHYQSFEHIFSRLCKVESLTGAPWARAALVVVAVLPTPTNMNQWNLLVKFLPLLGQLTEGGNTRAPSILCELGIAVLALYTQEINRLNAKDRRKVEGGLLAILHSGGTGPPEDRMLVDGSDESGAFLTYSDVRVAAFERLADVFEVLLYKRQSVLKTLLQAAASDPDLKARKAARECLEKVPLVADDLIALLQLDSSGDENSAKRRKRGNGKMHKVQQLPRNCTLALEVVQWKNVVFEEEKLLLGVQDLMHALLDRVKTTDVVWEEGGLEYMCRLCLAAFKRLVERIDDAETLQKLEGKVVVEFLRNAPDGSLRNEAMALLRPMVDKLPDKTLDHILEIFKLMGETGILEDNRYSRKLATETFAVAVPAWIEAGKGIEALWMTIIPILPSIHPTHRMSVLTSLLQPMPKVEGCAVALFSLLKNRNIADSEVYANVFHPAARELSRNAPISIRAKALAKCLSMAMEEESGERDASFFQLLKAVIHFIFCEIQFFTSNAVTSTSSGHAYDAALSSTCQDLLEETVKQLNVAEKHAKSAPKKHRPEWRKMSSQLMNIVAELKNQMDAQPYIKSLVGFMGSGLDARALELYAEKMNDMEAKGVNYYGPKYIQEMAAAALSICDPIKNLLSDPKSKIEVKQLAMGAIQSAVVVFGPSHPGGFPGVMEAVLKFASHNLASKGSAFVTMAALVKGLKTEAVPHLPKLVPAVIESAEAAVSKLLVVDAWCAPNGEMQEESIVGLQDTALELATSLSVIQELVAHLGTFISPYVQQILGIVLNPKVLGFNELSCGDLARAIGAEIPQRVPPRLMFEPMFDRFDSAVEGGEKSLIQLLEVVGVLASRLDPKSAANYSEQIFMFLLRALEIRQSGSLSMAATHNVESACISAFLQLVMKLSEKYFRPLFVRMVEWSCMKAGDGDRENLGRQVSFCRLVGDLAKRLRSMFVAYFDHFLEDAIKLLLGIESSRKQKKKKRKTTDGDVDSSLRQQQELYQLRLYLVRAVHRCALYDMVGFLTPEKIEELGPALVHQVKVGEPLSQVTEGLEFLVADSDLEGNYEVEEVDVLGTATVASLVNLAVAGGLEETWQAVNLKVLKASRKGSQYVRILVLEFEKHLINVLKEDFLSMVPETLPRLAEFLEDSEAVVSNRARDVIGLLEKLSGESYDQYLK